MLFNVESKKQNKLFKICIAVIYQDAKIHVFFE